MIASLPDISSKTAAMPFPTTLDHPGPPRILIADDDRNIRLALRACLEVEGYDIAEAQNGREALRAVVQQSPDLLLLDLAMPEMDGIAALRELATTYRAMKPRIVILTAWGSSTAAQSADRYGASAFLEKPLDAASLRSIIAQVLSLPRNHATPDLPPDHYLS